MSVRVSAAVVTIVGALAWGIGMIADAQRPDTTVVVSATPETAVVALTPDVLTLDGLERIAVNADGPVEAHTARPVDAQAWLADYPATYVMGFESWDALRMRTADVVDTEALASASASPTAEPTADASPEPSVEPSAEAEADTAPHAFTGSTDHWTGDVRGEGRVSVAASNLPQGEVLVFHTADGAAITSVDVTAQRAVNDGWITPLTWSGGLLTLVGVLGLLWALVDMRPLQARVEDWRAARRPTASEAPKEGSRRERRLATSALPVVSGPDATDADATDADATDADATDADAGATDAREDDAPAPDDSDDDEEEQR